MGAAALLGGAYDAHTAAAGFAGVAALAIAELSTTEAFAARASCLLCHGLLSCGLVVFVHDSDAWAQRRCSAGRMMCAQLALDRRCDGAGNSRIKHDHRGICREHENFAQPRLVFVCGFGACGRLQHARAATLLGKACGVCTASSSGARGCHGAGNH